MSLYHDTTSAVQSYLATGLGFMSDVNWMAVGAGTLLVARLIQDVPKAYETLKYYRNKDRVIEKRRQRLEHKENSDK